MKNILYAVYTIALALWTGGMAIFTFVLTPVIFKSYGRDTAGDIVGRLFTGYFLYLLVLSLAALLLAFLVMENRSAVTARLTLLLLVAALIVNTYVFFKLHPDAAEVKQRITSFERESKDSPARKEFSRLHAISAILNLFVLADGTLLLVLAPALRR